MAAIYDMSTGTIVSENTGVTTVAEVTDIPEYRVALQPVEPAVTPGNPGPCDDYMMLIQELLKDL